jgi:hypothetical protein
MNFVEMQHQTLQGSKQGGRSLGLVAWVALDKAPMPVVYCAVCQGQSILVEATHAKYVNEADYGVAATSILRKAVEKKVSAKSATWSKKMGDFEVHLRFKNNVTYLCMTDVEFGSTLSGLMLTDLVNEFSMHYMSILSNTSAELDSASFQDFVPILDQKMVKFSGEDGASFREALSEEQKKKGSERSSILTSNNNGKTARIKANLDDVKDVLGSAMNKAMARQEVLDGLDDKSESVSHSSRRFNQRSAGLSKSQFWNKLKQNLFIGIMIALFTVLLSFMVCGVDFGKC